MRGRQLTTLMSMAAFAGWCGSASAGPNLVQNGSFESYSSGSFTSWANSGSLGTTPSQFATPHPTNGTTAGPYGDVVPADPFRFSTDVAGTSGAYFVADATGPTGQKLSQTLALVIGTTYEVGFDLFPTLSGAANPNSFSLTGSIGGVSITTADQSNTTAGTWQHFARTFVATSATEMFDFTFLSGPSPAKDVIADLVYVGTPLTPLPEPASMALLGVGLLGVGLIRQRRVQS